MLEKIDLYNIGGLVKDVLGEIFLVICLGYILNGTININQIIKKYTVIVYLVQIILR